MVGLAAGTDMLLWPPKQVHCRVFVLTHMLLHTADPEESDADATSSNVPAVGSRDGGQLDDALRVQRPVWQQQDSDVQVSACLLVVRFKMYIHARNNTITYFKNQNLC